MTVLDIHTGGRWTGKAQVGRRFLWGRLDQEMNDIDVMLRSAMGVFESPSYTPYSTPCIPKPTHPSIHPSIHPHMYGQELAQHVRPFFRCLIAEAGRQGMGCRMHVYVCVHGCAECICVCVCGCIYVCVYVGAEGRKRGDVSPRRAGKVRVCRCRCIYICGDGGTKNIGTRNAWNGEWWACTGSYESPTAFVPPSTIPTLTHTKQPLLSATSRDPHGHRHLLPADRHDPGGAAGALRARAGHAGN